MLVKHQIEEISIQQISWSRESCPCPRQGSGMRCSLKSLPTQTSLFLLFQLHTGLFTMWLKSPLHSPQQPQPALSPPSNWPVIVSGIFSSMKPERKWNESAYRKNPYCSNKTQIHNLPTGNLWKEIFALFHNAWGRCWNADPCGGLKKNIINPVLESSNELLLAAFTAARVFFNISETVSPHGHAGWV